MNELFKEFSKYIWKSLDTFALIAAEKDLACSSPQALLWGQRQAF